MWFHIEEEEEEEQEEEQQQQQQQQLWTNKELNPKSNVGIGAFVGVERLLKWYIYIYIYNFFVHQILIINLEREIILY